MNRCGPCVHCGLREIPADEPYWICYCVYCVAWYRAISEKLNPPNPLDHADEDLVLHDGPPWLTVREAA